MFEVFSVFFRVLKSFLIGTENIGKMYEKATEVGLNQLDATIKEMDLENKKKLQLLQAELQ